MTDDAKASIPRYLVTATIGAVFGIGGAAATMRFNAQQLERLETKVARLEERATTSERKAAAHEAIAGEWIRRLQLRMDAETHRWSP